MRIAFSKGTKREGAPLKTKLQKQCGISQHKDRIFFDDLLPQGKTEQLRAYPLVLHLRFHGQRCEVQTTDRCPVKGI